MSGTNAMVVKVKASVLVGVGGVLFIALAGSAMAEGPRERISINDDWRFHQGDPADLRSTIGRDDNYHHHQTAQEMTRPH
ncbi:hypothetical protein [Parvularcula sp. LCG005]|uniref:hypothetical protein n=1 Tax=Parvularcula sp. LCG005 TaxID=3078805 RepID=UPI0029437776|nr:hypothetical protein [Parvularcula sp. LCG005]WOI52607.1 hypothetical protein RUI03_10660 [Parvularcula sp. LCG005]